MPNFHLNEELGDELDDDLYDEICEIGEDGNVLMDDEKYRAALSKFEAALDLLPEPKTKWEAYTWLKASTGDALFFLKQYAESKEELFDAMNGPDGEFNPFVLMRLGECFYETGDHRAQEFLLRAYMLEGSELFVDEDPKYYGLIEALVKSNRK